MSFYVIFSDSYIYYSVHLQTNIVHQDIFAVN